MGTITTNKVSQKINNYNYAPGIATYGIDGKTGKPGEDGNNIYFTDCYITDEDDLTILATQMKANKLLFKGSNTILNRLYKNGDYVFDHTGIIYELYNIDLFLNDQNRTSYTNYFRVAGQISVRDSSAFSWVGDRLVLNSSLYAGYDVIVGSDTKSLSQHIDNNTAVNIISDIIDENDNIEMVRMQSIDNIDVEDGKFSIYYNTTDNAFYLDSNKPIVINSDIQLNNNDSPEYDNFSSVLTSNDTITYFKHICDQLNYNVVYDNNIAKYKLVISVIDSVNDKQKIIKYLYNRNETVLGKIYTQDNNIQLIKLDINIENEEPYLYYIIDDTINSIAKFSLIHNTEIFLTFNGDKAVLDNLNDNYLKLRLKKYNTYYYLIHYIATGDLAEHLLIPDDMNYYEYSGETVLYENQTCYVWLRYHAGMLETQQGYEEKILTNSLHLSLPFTVDSPEFVASIAYGDRDIDFSQSGIKLSENTNLEDIYNYTGLCYRGGDMVDETTFIEQIDNLLPDKYKGLCILEKII